MNWSWDTHPGTSEKAEILKGRPAVPGAGDRSGYLHSRLPPSLEELASLLPGLYTLLPRGRQLSRVQSTAGTRAEPRRAAQPYPSRVNTCMDFRYRAWHARRGLWGSGEGEGSGSFRAPSPASAFLHSLFLWETQGALGTTSFIKRFAMVFLRLRNTPAREELRGCNAEALTQGCYPSSI